MTDKRVPAKAVKRRTLYRYLKELENEHSVQRIPNRRGFYELTKLGMKKLSFISRLYGANDNVPLVDPLGISFGIGRDEQGRTAYADILIRVTRPDVVQTIEEAMTKNKVTANEKMLGSILCTVIMWDLKGVFSRLNGMMEGNEDLLSRIVDKLPFTE